MEKVNFLNSELFHENAEKTFLIHKNKITGLLPDADIQHVGSSAIPNSLTKGDLDIQVRVNAEQFSNAVVLLSNLYESNDGSVKTDTFRAFKDDTTKPPLGIQLTVIDSEFDFFWKFREVLLANNKYRDAYDKLKKEYEAKSMDAYREAKDIFFQSLMETSEFKKYDK
ncbi:GrpB family protein [Lysinibacillus xylanilyticus]|uniref:GrpB family protein n=1 Tax=Lysinibacillus xylanilyticus TaxID=582475 RepID=UPI002B2416E9|nr:GrpB family protein [Lysinibacillus xylanilyticus]MEB2279583.1 GrpB family protein [Lysinibacillus xylanilyticus]